MQQLLRRGIALASAAALIGALSACSSGGTGSSSFQSGAETIGSLVRAAAAAEGLSTSTPVLGNFSPDGEGYAVLITRPSGEPQETEETGEGSGGTFGSNETEDSTSAASSDDASTSSGTTKKAALGVSVPLQPIATSSSYDSGTMKGTVGDLEVIFVDGLESTSIKVSGSGGDASANTSGGTSKSMRQDEIDHDDPRPYK